ncbi:MAG: hypothetical protein U5L00_21185 [Desulfovermiculus sp.]|nr:hypothetical protein [Desulfovermiculus sp.]
MIDVSFRWTKILFSIWKRMHAGLPTRSISLRQAAARFRTSPLEVRTVYGRIVFSRFSTGSTYPLPHQGKIPGRIQDLLQGLCIFVTPIRTAGIPAKRLMEKDNAFETENREEN